jgi:hypothetical protein
MQRFLRTRVFKKRNLTMTPAPPDLERQHLADLLESLMRCAFFSHSVSSRIPWSLTGELLESRCKYVALSDKLAAFNERFSKLEDLAAATMSHTSLLSGEKTTAFLRVLGFFEKVGVVKSGRDWQKIMKLRNMAARNYSIHYANIALHFNALQEILPELLGVTVRLVDYCQTKLSITPNKLVFKTDWQQIANWHAK